MGRPGSTAGRRSRRDAIRLKFHGCLTRSNRGAAWCVQHANRWIVEMDLEFIPAFAAAAPNGARFDSPGRLALGSDLNYHLSPEGARFQCERTMPPNQGISPLWGFWIVDDAYPGLNALGYRISPLLGLSSGARPEQDRNPISQFERRCSVKGTFRLSNGSSCAAC